MTKSKRTKIVATLGPATRNATNIDALIRAGVDVFRLNAAHSDHAALRKDIAAIRRISKKLKASIGILVDLQGPKIRVGPLDDAQPIWLQRGQKMIISCEPGLVGKHGGKHELTRVGCPYAGLAKDVKVGERILLDDGMIELKVVSVDGEEILTRVVYGGLLKQYKGINLPGSEVSMAALSTKDIADLRVVLKEEVDFIAISFVRAPEEVADLKRRVAKAGSDALVIAKIERPEAVARIPEILAESDGLMVARGDMGVELGAEVVPSVQKKIIRLCNEARKPVITATQMLESMITNPRPTRAEASDVANAIYDGTSAVMLSAETASGKYPLRAVRMMTRIIRRTETDLFRDWEFTRRRRRQSGVPSVTLATVRAAAFGALVAEAKAIAVFTESGSTAQLMAGERTETRIYAFTPSQRAVQRLALTWGVTAVKLSRVRTAHEMTLEGERILVERGIVKSGEHVAMVVGTTRKAGLANIMKLLTIESGHEGSPDADEPTKTTRSGSKSKAPARKRARSPLERASGEANQA